MNEKDLGVESDRICLVDVGVRDGIDPRWSAYIAWIDAYGFEPDPVECERLNNMSGGRGPTRFLPHALGASDGEQAVLHVCRQPGCSSLLRPNAALCNQFAYGPNLEVVKTIDVCLSRMDTVLSGLSVRPNVLKIDTQGSELAIIQGAGELLDSTLLVELEVEFAEQYIGQPLFSDVDRFMRGRRFALLGIKRSYWRRPLQAGWQLSAQGGQLIHGDALYLNPAVLDRMLENTPASAVGALLCLAAYRQDDLLLELLMKGKGKLGTLSEAVRRSLGGRLATVGQPWYGPIVRALSRGGTHREVRRAVDRSRQPHGSDWHDADFY